MHRRDFIKNNTLALGITLGTPEIFGSAFEQTGKPLNKKSLKYAMVEGDQSVTDKFKLLKELGFHGVEFDWPNEKVTLSEALKARDETGLQLPGTVNSMHWKSPLSSPDPKVRAVCAESMKKALRDTKELGGTTVLLVPAVVNAEISYEDAYKRSQEEIKKLLPVAEETGIKIALENVWNNFLLSPLETARYIDEINHPLVGAYFDVGNILRYGWPAHWIEALGKRIMKIDIKEFSLKKMNDEGLWKGFDVELMDGDCNWPAVNKALTKAGYSAGWGSAEVPGGDSERLTTISKRLDMVFNA